MNRTISFRAWHSKQNQWLHDKSWGGCHILGETIWLGEWCRVPIDELNDVVVEQNTGLKDKHGVDIFEGDILANPYGIFPDPTVVFKDGAFGIAALGKDHIAFAPFRDLLYGTVTYKRNGESAPAWDVIEVVGNIHEGAPPQAK